MDDVDASAVVGQSEDAGVVERFQYREALAAIITLGTSIVAERPDWVCYRLP